VKATVKLTDNITLEIEEQKEMETLHKAIVLGNPRRHCVECDATEGFYFTTNKSTTDEGTFTYVNYKCGKCGARSKLGQYKAGGYFWNEFEKWEGKKQTKEEPPTPEE